MRFSVTILTLSFVFNTGFSQAQLICRDGTPNCMLESGENERVSESKNVLGSEISVCSKSPMTGFFRDGTCTSNSQDRGNHSVCAELTKEFLEYTKSQGNDLTTPNPRYGFPGLKPGDKWCLCAARWLEAKRAGVNTIVDLEATHVRAKEVVNIKEFNKSSENH